MSLIINGIDFDKRLETERFRLHMMIDYPPLKLDLSQEILDFLSYQEYLIKIMSAIYNIPPSYLGTFKGA